MKIPSGDPLWPQGELKVLYRKYNRKYFGNKLTEKAEIRWCALGSGDEYGRCCPLGDGFVILLFVGEASREKAMHLTLLHEMAHIAAWDQTQAHGPKWKREMRRLAKIGAFDKWW